MSAKTTYNIHNKTLRNMKARHYMQTGVAVMAAAAIAVSCTDTWDDHYSENYGAGAASGETLWENMKKDKSLAPFMEVLEACRPDKNGSYKDMLDGNQTFTVWAPVITEDEARQWIDRYKGEGSKKREENVTLNQFVENHIALYGQPVWAETADTVKMMNGKIMTVTASTLNGEIELDGDGIPSSNGMLYKVKRPVPFTPDIWERIRMEATGGDDGLDSLYAFLRSWERVELDEEASVPGDINANGEQEYRDSVTYTYNEFLQYADAEIKSEDSLYWYVAPTNKAWRENYERYRGYFDYHVNNPDRDSLQRTYSGLMFAGSTFFSVRGQKQPFNEANPDSIVGTRHVSYSEEYDKYYKFERPKQPGGILYGLEPLECSNGLLYKASEWNASPTKMREMSTIKVEAENGYTIALDSQYTVATRVSASNLDSFKVSNGAYLVVRSSRNRPNSTLYQPQIAIEIPDILSNCPYDIKVVFASPLAGNAAATEDAALKRQITASIKRYSALNDKDNDEYQNGLAGRGDIVLCKDKDVDATKMDTITVTEGKYFDGFIVCGYGEDSPRAWLTIQSHRGLKSENGYTGDLAIDCVIFEPHPEAATGNDEK